MDSLEYFQDYIEKDCLFRLIKISLLINNKIECDDLIVKFYNTDHSFEDLHSVQKHIYVEEVLNIIRKHKNYSISNKILKEIEGAQNEKN